MCGLCWSVVRAQQPLASSLLLGPYGVLICAALESALVCASLLGLYANAAAALFHCAAIDSNASDGAQDHAAHTSTLARRRDGGGASRPAASAELQQLLGAGGRPPDALPPPCAPPLTSAASAGSEAALLQDGGGCEERSGSASRAEPPPYEDCERPPATAAPSPWDPTPNPWESALHPWGPSPKAEAEPPPASNPWGEPHAHEAIVLQLGQPGQQRRHPNAVSARQERAQQAAWQARRGGGAFGAGVELVSTGGRGTGGLGPLPALPPGTRGHLPPMPPDPWASDEVANDDLTRRGGSSSNGGMDGGLRA